MCYLEFKGKTVPSKRVASIIPQATWRSTVNSHWTALCTCRETELMIQCLQDKGRRIQGNTKYETFFPDVFHKGNQGSLSGERSGSIGVSDDGRNNRISFLFSDENGKAGRENSIMQTTRKSM